MSRVKEAIALLQRSPELIRAYIACIRYHVGKDAVRFTVQTLKDLPAEPPKNAKRLVFFAHYDPKDEVDEYVRFYLEKLYQLGSTIIFVSGSPFLKANSAAKIAPFCSGIYTRHTLSLDFGSWHLAWQQMKRRGWQLEAFDQFLLANDSVYGPLFDLQEMFSAFEGADMYGVTESKEQCPHLQSYFLLWNLNPKTRSFIEAFWREFRYVVRKRELIKRCELGLSQRARRCGLRQKAYISDAEARTAAAQHGHHQHMAEVSAGAVNNSLYLWDVLIADLRCPFLKTDLPRRNRYGSAKMLELSPFLQQWTEYDPRLIERNLERIGIEPSQSGTASFS
jgi:lipopolysaccharide biosynthesis protein